MTGYLIEDATPEDVPGLVVLENLFPSDHISARQFRYHIANPRAVLFVARTAEDRSPVGYALFLRRQNAARFYSLIVHPSEQGKGLGRRLCRAGLDVLVKTGVRQVTLEVDHADVRTIQLYQSMGFSITDTLPDYYADHRDAVRMKTTLEPLRRD